MAADCTGCESCPASTLTRSSPDRPEVACLALLAVLLLSAARAGHRTLSSILSTPTYLQDRCLFGSPSTKGHLPASGGSWWEASPPSRLPQLLLCLAPAPPASPFSAVDAGGAAGSACTPLLALHPRREC